MYAYSPLHKTKFAIGVKNNFRTFTIKIELSSFYSDFYESVQRWDGEKCFLDFKILCISADVVNVQRC